MKHRQHCKPLPPSLKELEARAWVKSLPIDDLGLLSSIIRLEMDERTGREKYRMPSIAPSML